MSIRLKTFEYSILLLSIILLIGCRGGGTESDDLVDVLNDADNDGYADNVDACQGYDDSVDPDNDGVPSGCDLCEG
ncbi:MAG: hypothetical protein V3U16_01215, partial [Candidatus Neomarinimicrobiota bacterium]